MDPRDRAEAQLARARARGGHVVTPDSATSPMDSASTVQIPRVLVDAADPRQDSDSTMILPPGTITGHQGGQQSGSPQQQVGHGQQQQPTQPRPGPPHQGQQQRSPGQQTMSGLVPTTPQTPPQRPSLAERLNGDLADAANHGDSNGQRDERPQWEQRPDQRWG